jgi:hypothetical protein
VTTAALKAVWYQKWFVHRRAMDVVVPNATGTSLNPYGSNPQKTSTSGSHDGWRTVRSFMTDQHREFIAGLPFLAVGSVDSQG